MTGKIKTWRWMRIQRKDYELFQSPWAIQVIYMWPPLKLFRPHIMSLGVEHSNVTINNPDVMRVKKHWSAKFSVNCVTCTPSPCVLLQFAFTGQESKESWERTSMKYHMPGNLATVLIWRFSDSEVNHQIKKSPIIIIRYQSRPDTCAAPSPSSNKCAHVWQQSYS